MSAPFTPDESKALISDPTSSLCGNFVKTLLRLPVFFYQFVSALVDSTGQWILFPSPGDYIFSAAPLADTNHRKLCNGQELSKTNYAVLYAAIGDVYATMDGQAAPSSGNFRVPKVGARMPMANGTLPSSTAVANGGVGGEEKHKLTVAEGGMNPEHIHTTGRMSADSNDDFGDDVVLLTGTSDKDGPSRQIFGDNQINSAQTLGDKTGAYTVTSDVNNGVAAADFTEHNTLPPYWNFK